MKAKWERIKSEIGNIMALASPPPPPPKFKESIRLYCPALPSM